MIYSYYQEITRMKDASPQDLRDKLIAMDLGYIFEYVWNNYWDSGGFKPIVLYAAYAYSWETEMVRIGGDWIKTKQRIAEKVNLPKELYEPVMELKGDEKLKMSFLTFLNLYRDNMDWVHLCNLKDTYQELMLLARTFKVDDGGNADVKGRFQNIERCEELLEKIEIREQALLAKYRILNSAQSDFTYDQVEHGNPLVLENSRHIRG